jgi:hypothetical protein
MFKVKSGLVASSIAREKGMCWGHDIFGYEYYVGTSEELKKIGVIDIKTSNVDN